MQLGWLPSFGRGDTVALGWWTTGLLTKSGLKALILPAITLSLFQMTLIMRLVRSEMLEVLRTDYIKFARARGLSDRAIHFGHALKNTLVPVITIIGLQLGAIIAFAIVTETVFQWPGMGLLFIQSVYFADIPVMAAYLCFIALVFVLHQPASSTCCTTRSIPACASSARRWALTKPMKPTDYIRRWHDEFTAIRRDLHAHPELGFEEHRTARVVQEQLAALGIEHHTGIGKTGIVAVIPGDAARAGASSACAPTWTRCRCRRKTSSRTSRATRAACTAAVTTATRRCCWPRRATCTRPGASTAPPTSSSSRARKAMPAPRR